MRAPARSAAILVVLLLAPTSPLASEGVPLSAGPETVRARWLMGTVLELRLPHRLPEADALAEAAFAEVARVEAAASLWRPGTELETVHRRCAAGAEAVLSPTLGALVEEALRAAELTGGTYSPAVGSLVAAWDLRGEGRTPDPATRARAAAAARPSGVRYDRSTGTLRLDPGVALDLDGIAKGFALDRAASALRARGVDDALLNFGGQLLAIGPPRGRPAREGIVLAPGGDPLLSVPLRDASLSTSSNSERVRTVDGERAGHLLDPRTGDLVPFDGSVAVLASRGALADALSTAWAVEGPEGYRRSDPGGAVRRAGAVAFVLPGRGGACEVLTDRPYQRLRPPARAVAAADPEP